MGKQMTEMLKGTLEGIVLAILSGAVRLRLRDHGVAAGAGLLRHRRRHRLRAAHQDRAARPCRRGEGPVREGAAAQGVLAQRNGDGTTSKSSGGPGASSPNGSNSSTKAGRVAMAARGSSWSPGRSSRRSSTGSTRRASRRCPSRTRTVAKALQRYFMYNGGIVRRRDRRQDVGRLRRPLRARRGRRHAGARDRRRRPSRVRRHLRPGLHRQAVDRQGTRAPDQGDRGRGARRSSK